MAPPPPSTVPAAPAPAKSGSALKIILISLAVIVILVVVGVVGVGLFVTKVVHDNVSIKEGAGGKGEVSINTPAGKLNVSSKPNISEAELGVPIYPGATQQEGTGSISFQGSDQKSGSFGGAAFTTTDAFEKVVDFYKQRLGSKASVWETTDQGKRSAVLSVTLENSSRTIVIEDQGNGVTKIAVSSISRATPQ